MPMPIAKVALWIFALAVASSLLKMRTARYSMYNPPKISATGLKTGTNLDSERFK
jgi:hypothetical protein